LVTVTHPENILITAASVHVVVWNLIHTDSDTHILSLPLITRLNISEHREE